MKKVSVILGIFSFLCACSAVIYDVFFDKKNKDYMEIEPDNIIVQQKLVDKPGPGGALCAASAFLAQFSWIFGAVAKKKTKCKL